jgi:hypothetical protein
MSANELDIKLPIPGTNPVEYKTYRLFTKHSGIIKSTHLQHVNAHFDREDAANGLLKVEEQVVFAKEVVNETPSVESYECLLIVFHLNVKALDPTDPNPEKMIDFPDKKFNLLGVDEDIFPVRVYNTENLFFELDDIDGDYHYYTLLGNQSCEGFLLPEVTPPFSNPVEAVPPTFSMNIPEWSIRLKMKNL